MIHSDFHVIPPCIDDVIAPSTRYIMFSPPITDPIRCVNISFGDDDLVEPDQYFVVVFTPSNDNDVFVDDSVANVTIVDDEGTKLSRYFMYTLYVCLSMGCRCLSTCNTVCISGKC